MNQATATATATVPEPAPGDLLATAASAREGGWKDMPPPPRDWTANRAGRAMAMTLLTPLRPGGALGLRLRLLVNRFSFGIFGKAVYDLSFLHYAHWSVLRTLPGRQAGRGAGYMLFESNYNGTWHNYIDTFSAVVGDGMAKMLRFSEGFPGMTPVQRLKDYVEGHEYVTGHYYSAYERYEEASATVITAALDLDARLRRFARRARGMGADEFAVAWPAFLAGAQLSLVGASPPRMPRRWFARRARSVTVIAPIRAGHTESLAALLSDMEAAETSPLAVLDDLHLGRWVILGWAQEGSHPAPPRALTPACLLFTADIQGGRTAFLKNLTRTMAGPADDVWQHCEGWPGVTDAGRAARYLSARREPARLFFAAYGRYGVADVRRALERRRRLIDHVAEVQGRPALVQLDAFTQLADSLGLTRRSA